MILKYLLLILLIIFVYRLFSFVNRFKAAFKSQQNNTRKNYTQNQRNEGEVNIDYSKPPKKEKVVKKDEGDYIDFEDVS